MVVSADTVVVHEDQILEKPKDRAHAVRMLSSLSGDVHYVLTAVTLIDPARFVVTGLFSPSPRAVD